MVNATSSISLIDKMKTLSTVDEIVAFVEAHRKQTVAGISPEPTEIFNNNVASITEFEPRIDCGPRCYETFPKSLYIEDKGNRTDYQVIFDNAHKFDHFQIDASNFTNNAYIALSRSPNETSIEWEIVFGGWAGNYSAIRTMIKI